MVAVREMLCLPHSMTGYGFAVRASAVSRCSLCLPWVLLMPKISSLWLCQRKAWVTAVKPASLQNQAVGTKQSGFWCAASSFMLSFQQPLGLFSEIDTSAKKILGWNIWIEWAHGAHCLSWEKRLAFPPCCREMKNWGVFLIWSFCSKKETYPLSSNWAAFSEFGEQLRVLWNSNLNTDWDAATLCNSQSWE